MSSIQTRREFLKAVSLFAGTTIVAGSLSASGKSLYISEDWHLNPAFRIKNLNDNRIELYTFKNTSEKISYTFTNFEADLLRSLNEEKDLTAEISALGAKYHFSEPETRKKVMKYLNDYKKAALVYTGKPIPVRVVEVGNVK